MTEYRLNYTLLFALITAFLTMQWTTTHIHLAEHHNHDGGHHKHSVEVHAHNSIDNPVNVNVDDFSHQPDSLNVVELDYEFSAKKIEKLDKAPNLILLSTAPYLKLIIFNVTALPTDHNTTLSYLYRSTTSPRAPPEFA